MKNKPGIYRVIYNISGSLGYFKQQFIYTTFMGKSVNEIAKNRAIIQDSKRYDIKKSDINISKIEFVRPLSENQRTLQNEAIFDK